METLILSTVLVLMAAVYFVIQKNTYHTERNHDLIKAHSKKIMWVLARHARSVDYPFPHFVWCLYNEADQQGEAGNKLEQNVKQGNIIIKRIEIHDPRNPEHTDRGQALHQRLETSIAIPPILTSEQLLSRVYTPPGQGDKLTAFDPFGDMRIERTHNTPPSSSSLSDGSSVILSDELQEGDKPTK